MSSFKGLGKGLGALFQDEDQKPGEVISQVVSLRLTEIAPNPTQPRKEFDPDALRDLSDSIKSQGVLQPILVRRMGSVTGTKYEIIAGERRWRAAQKAGLTEMPAMVKELNDQETLAVALIENLQREDLNPLEEALGIKQLKDDFGLSQEDLAKRLSKSRSAIANTLRLLNLPDAAQQDLLTGKISQGHARALLGLDSVDQQLRYLEAVKKDKLSVRELEGLVASDKQEDVDRAFVPEENPISARRAQNGKKSLPKSAVMLQLQSRIAQAVKLPVKMSGQSNKGRISIHFSSKDELLGLLEQLGVSADITGLEDDI